MNENDIVQMVADLRAFSAELAERNDGKSITVHIAGKRDRTSAAARVSAKAIVALARAASQQLEQHELVSDRETQLAVVPRGASARALHARQWRESEAGWLPARWETPAIEYEPNAASVRWLLHATELALAFFERRHERLLEWVREAKSARARGESEWARKAEIELDALLTESAADLAQSKRTKMLAMSFCTKPARSSPQMPTPFPRQPTWMELRQHVVNLEQPRRLVADVVSSALSHPVEVCDIPVLYQRWVGLQLLKAFEANGWKVVGSPVGVLWLGGRVTVRKGGRKADIRIEFRFSRGHAEDTLECVIGPELTPDYCIVFETRTGPRAWILDATISGDEALASEKQQKYLRGLRHTMPRFVAGHPVFARPMRSWVAMPIPVNTVRLGDPDGFCGCVGLHPGQREPAAGLVRWIGDLDEFNEPASSDAAELRESKELR